MSRTDRDALDGYTFVPVPTDTSAPSSYLRPPNVLREIGLAHDIPSSFRGRRVTGAMIAPVRTSDDLHTFHRHHRADDEPPFPPGGIDSLLGRMGTGVVLFAYTYFVEPKV